MASPKKRVYNSDSRLAQAEETKAGLLKAAKRLFQAKGFDRVTIDEIARAGMVSAATVYALFKSKLGILSALLDEALPSEQYQALVEIGESPEFPVAHRLEIAARIARQLYDAEKDQIDFLRGAAVLNPDLKKLEAEKEERRYQRLQKSVQLMAAQGAIKKELSISMAHDIMWTFTGRDLYRMLVVERGWSSNKFENWLANQLKQSLLDEDQLS